MAEETSCGLQLPWHDAAKRKNFTNLQHFSNLKFALLLFWLVKAFSEAVVNGLFGATLSTFEKRFQLKSTEMGMIAGCKDIGEIVGLTLMLLYGENRHKPMWIALAAVLMAMLCFVISLPHFVAPRYIPTEKSQTGLCQNGTSDECTYSSIQDFKFVFLFAFLLYGLGSAPLKSHAIPYIDENTSKAKSSLYFGIYLTSSASGPVIGYIVGGATLELYTYIGQEPDGMTSSSYAWVGAWWLGFIICGIVILVMSIFIYMLPKNMLRSEEFKKNRNDEMQASKSADVDTVPNSTKKSLKYLFGNKCLMLCIAGNALNFAFLDGFCTFGAKYFESQLGVKPISAAALFAFCAITSGITSQILSGIILSKYKLNVQQIIKYMLICSVISACCSFGFLIHCPDINFAGATVPYHGSNETGLRSPCNANCTCSTDIYEPVCGSDEITYFSPCFAGCNGNHDNVTLSNCSCILYSANLSNTVSVGGLCEQYYCSLTPLFTLCVILAFFTSLATYPPSTQVTLRCIPFEMRVQAISLYKTISIVLGTIPGRILTGYVVDLACAAWRTECGSQGSCAVYNKWEMARNMALILLAETWCMVGVYVMMLYVYEPQAKESKTEKTDAGEPMLELSSKVSL